MSTLGAKVKERLFSFIEHMGMSKLAFEKVCGLSNGYLRNFKGNLGEDKLSNILTAFPELNKDWLLYGEGSMLQGETSQPSLVAEHIPQLSNVEILLRDMLAEKEAKIDTLQELIWELKEENGRLKEQLRTKGGDVRNAVDSSSAVA